MNLVVLNWRDFTHPESGGAELYCQSVAAELAASGETVTYVTSRSPGTSARETYDGYTIIRRGSRFTVYVWVLWYLLRHRRKIDGVIDSQNGIPFFSPAVLRRRTPIVLLMHHVHQEQFALYFPPVMAAVGRWLESTVARRVYGQRIIAAVSPSTRSAVRTELRLKGPIRLAPCGVQAPPELSDTRSATPRIVVVGRLVPHKRVELLIEAMAQIRQQIPLCDLHIVGDGTERSALTAQAAELGLQDCVTFHGRVSDAERDKWLATAWVTVNPTQGEGWGLSVVEANRFGVPAVAFPVDGLRDSVVHGITGWLVQDGQTLADTLVLALDGLRDPHHRRQIESATRAWASSFTWSNTSNTLLDMLTEEGRQLALSDDRRGRQSDLMTIVEIPQSAVPVDWSPPLRTSDVLRADASGYRLLMLSVGHAELPDVLRRFGIADEAIESGAVRISVAGQQEALLLSAGIDQLS